MLTNRALLGMIGLCVLLVCLCLPSWAQSALDKPGTKAGDTATGPDGGVYVWVPAGEFDMGSIDGDKDEQPPHHVRITKGFWLGKCTVTNAQYQRYCQETGKEFPKDSDQGDNHPVVLVSWDDAAAYCKHYGLALPTEAQWEYAARGHESRRYPWGNDWDPKKCCNRDNQGPGGKTFPVGSFPEGASWCGALDMAGNVWQWCKDYYGSKYYASSPVDDPPGPDTGESFPGRGLYWILRGGSWDSGASICRCSVRGYSGPSDISYGDIRGFRCSRTP